MRQLRSQVVKTEAYRGLRKAQCVLWFKRMNSETTDQFVITLHITDLHQALSMGN